MHPIINVATKVARRAGNLMLRHIEKLDSIKVETKGRNDYVSEVDRQIEHEIISQLQRTYPRDAFLGEESGQIGESDNVWIIDPLDGTTNFLRGIPHYCISIALEYRGQVNHGIVYDPIKEEMFYASRGEGAYFNDRRIRVTESKSTDTAMIATGIPMRNPANLPAYMNMLGEVVQHCGGIRRAGSAALDLAYVAAGRVDGYFESGLQSWDIAAGALLVKEAGGFVSDFNGGDDYMKTGNVIAGNNKVFNGLQDWIKPHRSDALKK